MTDALSSHYARALADAVFGPGSGLKPEEAMSQLAAVVDLVRHSKELQWALLSPSVSRARKSALTGKMADLLELHRLLRNFFMVLVKHRRIHELSAIRQSFEQIAYERLGFIQAKITSAVSLAPGEREQIERALGLKTGKFIRPEYVVDPALLGGVIAHVGSTEYDGTVKGRLENMRRRLAQPS